VGNKNLLRRANKVLKEKRDGIWKTAFRIGHNRAGLGQGLSQGKGAKVENHISKGKNGEKRTELGNTLLKVRHGL